MLFSCCSCATLKQTSEQLFLCVFSFFSFLFSFFFSFFFQKKNVFFFFFFCLLFWMMISHCRIGGPVGHDSLECGSLACFTRLQHLSERRHCTPTPKASSRLPKKRNKTRHKNKTKEEEEKKKKKKKKKIPQHNSEQKDTKGSSEKKLNQT